ncbi:MAG TPA: phytase [Solirubrobacteraceae bacterium]|nr:phytase [Solirubrobacteraceae bacterium]
MAHRSACRTALERAWLRPALIALIALVLVALPSVAAAQVQTIDVHATVETAPMPHVGDAADDPAVWIHPTDPSLSTIIGTDKEVGGGLGVYDLSGNELFYYAHGRLNNVDVKYNFPLGGSKVSLVGATNRLAKRMDFYRVDPATRALVKIGSVATPNVVTPRGIALYVSPVSGKYYAFITDIGRTEQFELSGASGAVTGKSVRTFDMPVKNTEGLVADDELGRIYIAEENIGGVYRLGAEPGDSNVPVLVDATTENGGTIPQDIKGITIYFGANGTGYLIAASQGGNTFHIYRRGDNAKVGVFRIVDGAIDGVTGMDGIDVTNFDLGPAFPQGLFVTQDHQNPGLNQNFKAVPWQSIANGFSSPLLIDNSWDPRLIGGSGAPADVTPPTITSTTPATGASGVPVSTTVRAVFSELMSPATVTGTNFSLARQGQTASVPATVAYDQATRTATLRPTAGLAPNATYTATVKTGVRDVSANAMAAPKSWSFTTAAAGTPPPPPPPPPPPSEPPPSEPPPTVQAPPAALSVTAPPALAAPATASSASPAADTTAPAASLTGSTQRLGMNVVLGISCTDEACRATAAGTIRVPKAGNAKAKTYKLTARTTAIGRGMKATVRLSLSGSARAAIRRALRSGARVVVSLRVSVADGAGNSRTLTRRIRLRR